MPFCQYHESLKQRGDEESGHNADEDYLDQGADDVADKGAEGRLEGAFGLFSGEKQLEEESPQEGAQDNAPEAEEDYAYNHTDKGAQDTEFAGLELFSA